MKRNQIFFIAGMAALCGAATAGIFAQDLMPMPGLSLETPAQNPEETLTPEQLDSLREVKRQARIEKYGAPARADYATLRTMRFEGTDEASFYPQVLKTYQSNLTALDSLAGEADEQTSKAVIIDIRPEILDGAFFFSQKGNNERLGAFARAYIDIPLLPQMAGEDLKSDPRTYPTLAYIAASSAYNGGEFKDAIKYFDQYLSTNADAQRENVFMFLGQACLKTGDYAHAVDAMAEAAILYPANYHVLTHGIQACIDGKQADRLQFFLDKALLQNPADEQLLLIQGQLYEDEQDYKKALDIFQRLDMIKPNTLQVNKHLALCYFNLGVFHYNQAIMEEDEKAAKRAKRQSNSFFNEAAQRMEAIVSSDPRAVKYLEAAAVCYGCTDNMERFTDANNRLRALGREQVKAMSMPSMIAFNDDNSTNYGTSDSSAKVGQIPSYNDFASDYVSKEIVKWAERGTYEKMEDYAKRVDQAAIGAVYDKLTDQAEKEYIKKYGKQMRVTDLELKGYDPDNETYLISTSYGNLTLPVPISGKEAEMFSSSFNKVSLRQPRFIIRDDRPAIAELTFVTPNGKSYTYNSADAANYVRTYANIDWRGIVDAQRDKELADGGSKGTPTATGPTITFKSDVDENIPLVKRPNDNTVALIIANENYNYATAVASAKHDGDVFAEYCQKTLGIPARHIIKTTDATLGGMRRAIADARGAVGNVNAKADANLIVYYAGHGMPDEATKDAFLLPVDGDPTVTSTCLSLKDFYKDLDNMNARNVMVFLDACFTGAQRGEGMLVQARSVVLKPNDAAPQGNMYVLSATSGQETAMPYKAKNHGMFTYFLLKKLQDSKGNATLAEIGDYVIKNVKDASRDINHKPQTPTVSVSGPIAARLQNLKLR